MAVALDKIENNTVPPGLEKDFKMFQAKLYRLNGKVNLLKFVFVSRYSNIADV